MTFEEVGDFIINNGISVLVVCYFLWKDSKLTKENTEILQQVKQLLELMTNQNKKG